MSQGLAGVRKAARENKEMKVHRFTPPSDRRSATGKLLALKRKAAPGVDGVTWQEYETDWRIG